jgi:hypothetical protein
MTEVDERLFMLDLAIAQLISGILVTLGSTLFAISIGFGLSIPSTVQDVIFQLAVLNTEISPEVQQTLVQQSLSNYVLLLASFSVALIIAGVVFASAKFNKIRRQIKEKRTIQDLISTDINQEDKRPRADGYTPEISEA